LSEVTARCFDVTESGELKQDLTSNKEKKWKKKDFGAKSVFFENKRDGQIHLPSSEHFKDS
jgi:hypothetical protein